MSGKIVGGSEIGLYHLQSNTPNQDSFNYEIYNNIVVGAVADGMGSRKFSQIGSKALTKLVVKLAKNFNNKKRFEKKLLTQYKQKIKPYKVDDCLSTLMFVIIKNNKVYIAKVGDGAVVVIGKKDKIIEEKDKLFGNFTTAFSIDKLNWYQFRKNEIDTLFLATDGISDDIEKKIEFVRDFKNYFCKNKKRDITTLLKNWPVKGSIDDKTLLCIKV